MPKEFKRVDWKASYDRVDGYAYSDSEGNMYFGMTKEEAVARHKKWGIPPFWLTDEEEQPSDDTHA